MYFISGCNQTERSAQSEVIGAQGARVEHWRQRLGGLGELATHVEDELCRCFEGLCYVMHSMSTRGTTRRR